MAHAIRIGFSSKPEDFTRQLSVVNDRIQQLRTGYSPATDSTWERLRSKAPNKRVT